MMCIFHANNYCCLFCFCILDDKKITYDEFRNTVPGLQKDHVLKHCKRSWCIFCYQKNSMAMQMQPMEMMHGVEALEKMPVVANFK